MSKIDEGFTQKEMLIRILDKLEKMEGRINETHELAKSTNGKVKIHSKIIYGMGGGLITLTGWFIYHLISQIN